MLHFIENALFGDLVLSAQVLNRFEFASELLVSLDVLLQVLAELVSVDDQLLLPDLELVRFNCQILEVLRQLLLPPRLSEETLLNIPVGLVGLTLLALELKLFVLKLGEVSFNSLELGLRADKRIPLPLQVDLLFLQLLIFKLFLSLQVCELHLVSLNLVASGNDVFF